MTIKPPPSHYQPNLLDVLPDKPLTKNGEARTRYGQVVESIVTRMLGLTDIPNSGTHDVVFDAFHHGSGSYCEIKSLRWNNKLPIYEWRRIKDRDCGANPVYVIAVHHTTNQPTLAKVWERMAETLQTIYIVPHWVIDLEARRQPLRQLVQEEKNTRMGYKRKGYCDGYRNIPFQAISHGGYVQRFASGELHGLSLRADVNFHPSIQPWL